MNPVAANSQMTLDFRPGLAERYDTALECVKSCIYSNEKPLKTIAANMDISPSDLSRKLSGNPDDPRRFSISDLESYVQITGDTTPILYLAQKFCVGNDEKQRAALSALANLAPQLQALLKAAGVAG
ncbi:phage regulatory CII family protein [Variovorax sp. RT4R15]